MIISKVERMWTIVVAVLMLIAAALYAYSVSGLSKEQLSFADLCWIYSPTVLLGIYGVILLLCYRQRGLRWKQGYRVDISGYQGDKYPWL